jgi:hypothetical protein
LDTGGVGGLAVRLTNFGLAIGMSGLWVCMVVVYGCEGGLVVVLVLICVRIGFVCRFEG